MPLITRNSIFTLQIYALGALGFVVTGIWLMTIPHPEAMFWGFVSVVFFGFCGVIAVRRCFDRRDVLIIDSNGILDRRFSTDLIPWTAILEIREVVMHRQTLFALILFEPDRFVRSYRQRLLIYLNSHLGAHVFISAHGLETSTNDLRRALEMARNSSCAKPVNPKPA